MSRVKNSSVRIDMEYDYHEHRKDTQEIDAVIAGSVAARELVLSDHTLRSFIASD